MNISEACKKRINDLLAAKGISQAQLERSACLSHDTVKSIMKGKAKGVNLRTVISLARGFNMTASEFLDAEYFNDENLDF